MNFKTVEIGSSPGASLLGSSEATSSTTGIASSFFLGVHLGRPLGFFLDFTMISGRASSEGGAVGSVVTGSTPVASSSSGGGLC